MKRREFITLLGGAASVAARGVGAAGTKPVVGLLQSSAPAATANIAR